MKLSDIKAGLDNLVAAEGSELQRRAARLTRLCDMFFAHYGDGEVSLLRAPARINVLGEHVDYVSYMPTASLTFGSRERDALMLYRPSAEPIVRCVSSSARYAPVSFSICWAKSPSACSDKAVRCDAAGCNDGRAKPYRWMPASLSASGMTAPSG